MPGFTSSDSTTRVVQAKVKRIDLRVGSGFSCLASMPAVEVNGLRLAADSPMHCRPPAVPPVALASGRERVRQRDLSDRTRFGRAWPTRELPGNVEFALGDDTGGVIGEFISGKLHPTFQRRFGSPVDSNQGRDLLV